MPIVTIGLDLAKSVFQLHAIDEHGAVIMRKRLTRGQVLPVLEKIPPCLVGLAGPKLHIWAFIRTMREQITRLNSAGTSRRFRLAS